MVNQHLKVLIYIDKSWSMLIKRDHMMHENKIDQYKLTLGSVHQLSINFD